MQCLTVAVFFESPGGPAATRVVWGFQNCAYLKYMFFQGGEVGIPPAYIVDTTRWQLKLKEDPICSSVNVNFWGVCAREMGEWRGGVKGNPQPWKINFTRNPNPQPIHHRHVSFSLSKDEAYWIFLIPLRAINTSPLNFIFTECNIKCRSMGVYSNKLHAWGTQLRTKRHHSSFFFIVFLLKL